MQDPVSRLGGLEGFEVKRVIEWGDRVDRRSSWWRAPPGAPIAGAPCSTSRTARGCGWYGLPASTASAKEAS
jgi:hypothetical protein